MKNRKRKPLIEDMGLCFSEGAMVYGVGHGALRWAPEWVKHTVCKVWNKTHCFIKGHNQFGYDAYTEHVIPGPPTCSHCCARLKINGRYPTQAEVDAHDELCYKGWEEAETKWRLENPEEAAEHDRIQKEWLNTPPVGHEILEDYEDG